MAKNGDLSKLESVRLENFKYLERCNSREIINGLNQLLIANGYFAKDLEERKTLLDESIKQYFGFNSPDFLDLSAFDIVELIYKNSQNSIWKSHLCVDLTHFILGLVGGMQGKCVVWYGNQTGDETILAQRDEDGKWDSIKGPVKGKDLELFKETYRFFMEEFGFTKDKKKMNLTFIY